MDNTQSTTSHNATLLLGRSLLALIFILSGLSKISAYAYIQAYMQSVGLPGELLGPTIAFELISGICLVLGMWTRTVAILLAGFSVVTGAIFHHAFGDQIQLIMFLKNLAMAGGFLVLATIGAGRFSVDQRLKKQ